MDAIWIAAGVLAVLAVLFAVLLIRVIIPHAVDRRIERYQRDLIAAHVEEVQNIYQKMRGWRHDYKNHIQAMKAHLALSQTDELREYLDRLDEDLEMVDTVLKTGNVRLDAILNSKLSLLARKEIRVNAKAQVPDHLTVGEVDLCVIVGNLLNNAMESCERIADGSERFIRVYIGVFKGQLYISITNAAGEVRKLGPKAYLSAKGNGHGFGLRRIDALVEKYGGYLNRQSEPGVFATEILLPL